MKNTRKKYYNGEKYIYLLMAYQLCRSNKNGSVEIGKDNGIIGGQHFYRHFRVLEHDNKMLLTETKNGARHQAYNKTYQIGYSIKEKDEISPAISDYIDEYGTNCGQNWQH